MKKLFAFLTLSAAFALCACENDEHYTWPVPPGVVDSFYEMYPTATNVKWHRSGVYSVAEFNTSQNGAQQERWAWYDAAGTWYMTETDIAFAQLPQPVQAAFNDGAYGSWQFADGDMLERAALEDIYVVEAEGSGNNRNTTAALYYTSDGVLVKTVIDPSADYHYSGLLPALLPAQVSAFIQAEYPAARIIITNFGQTMARIEILDEGVLRTLYFNANNNWLYTQTAVEQNELPEAVTTALASSQYASYTIADIYFYNTAQSGNFYRLSLQSADGDVQIDVTPEGTITEVTASSPSMNNSALLVRSTSEFIASKYPGAVIGGFGYEDGLLMVNASQNGQPMKVYFNGAGSWVRTVQDVKQADLPSKVTAAIASSQYASYAIGNIDYYQTPWYDYYNIDMTSSGGTAATMKITAQGTVLQ